jgi:hypothetical protein
MTCMHVLVNSRFTGNPSDPGTRHHFTMEVLQFCYLLIAAAPSMAALLITATPSMTTPPDHSGAVHGPRPWRRH